MKKFAVVLTGCGYQDGSEITEAVSTLIALSEQAVAYDVFAPGDEKLKEDVARITRNPAQDLSALKADEFDAVVFPGGFGAAKHLCSWAQDGSNCSVHPEAERVIKEFYAQSKPIGAICIAPALIAKVLGSKAVTLTIGNDKETAQEIEKTGAQHVECPVDDYITDRETKVVSTPAYMYNDALPNKVFKGVTGLIKELVEMA